MVWVDLMYHQEWKDIDAFIEKYGPVTNPEAYSNLVVILQFYECLGLLVRKKIVDIDLVYEHIGGLRTIRTWERLESLLKAFREISDRPTDWVSFEFLYNELKKYEQQQETS